MPKKQKGESIPVEPEAGYAKPPKAHQFKKGQSGNPRGRPKGSKNMSTLMERELASTITIEHNGNKRKIRRKEALVKSLVNDALKGRDRPREKVFDYVERIETKGDDRIADDVSADDAAIIDRYIKRRKASDEQDN